jgi:hypothetical protein
MAMMHQALSVADSTRVWLGRDSRHSSGARWVRVRWSRKRTLSRPSTQMDGRGDGGRRGSPARGDD